MMKKRVALFLLMSVFIQLLSACGNNTESSESKGSSESSITADSRVIKTPNFEINMEVPDSDSIDFPGLIGDNMVLQRETVVRLWGFCDQDGPIAVRLNEKNYFGEAKDGKWEVYIDGQPAGGPYDITVLNKNGKAAVRNVLFGDVYICAGQSNMVMAMGSIDETQDIKSSENQKIRLLQVTNYPTDELVDEGNYYWLECYPDTVPSFTAVGYYFGKTLQEKYNIPIGLIMAAEGDTILSCWTPEPEASQLPKNYQGVSDSVRRKPAYYYNGMIHPLRKYTVKGVLWYQGENQPENYDTMLTTMINSWRRQFENNSLKFIIVQLPRWGGGNDDMWYLSRENQKKAALSIDNTTYSVNIDCGDEIEIHPKDKKVVGIRAAYAAMEAFYGEEGTLRGPVVKKCSFKGKKVVVEFENTGNGLELKNDGSGFELWDGTEYFAAKAEIKENTVIVTSDKISKPIGIRYAYGAYPDVSLYNKEGFPAEQFKIEK